MRAMLEGVVLRGTGKKAILDGYSSAGKTGTAQKIDPATGRYSKSQYIASFSGFAPVNAPAVSVLVILDSPEGPHEGGQVAAPVFGRVMQQVLGYMNVAHDVELQDRRRLLLRAQAKPEDISEASPDTIAQEEAPFDAAPSPALNKPSPATPNSVHEPRPKLVAAAVHSAPTSAPAQRPAPLPAMPAQIPIAATSTRGTVVVDVGNGVTVPDFRGKALRAALEEAESNGVELEISGSGVGREQFPPPGTKIQSG